jgi:glucokinase
MAIFEIAAPIEGNKVKLINSKLVIDSNLIKKKTSLKEIVLMNDLMAISYSIMFLKSSQLKIINKGKKRKDKNVLIVAPGTGLGKSVLVYNGLGKDYVHLSSEGGHQDFPIFNQDEFELVNFIRKKLNINIIKYEDLVSGRGVEFIYEFLSNKKLNADEISKLKKQDKFAKETFNLFYKFLARFLKNSSIDLLSTGGIYLAGGVVQKNCVFSKKIFMDEFTNSHVFSKMLKDISISIVKVRDVNIIGIGNYILRQ